MNIDTVTYSKSTLYPPDGAHGYGPVVNNGPAKRRPEEIFSIIIHTTNGNKGTRFDAEAGFIYKSKDISAHYLVGKDGQVIQFLEPEYIAWHAGPVNDPDCDNYNSIGIESHITIGEDWNTTMYAALTALVASLLQRYATIRKIVTHRGVAIFGAGQPRAGQLGRKIDPSGWSNDDFAIWSRNLLLTARTPPSAPIVDAKPGVLGTFFRSPSIDQAQVIKYTINRLGSGLYTPFDAASIVRSYWNVAQLAGIDPALMVAQMLHETGNLSSWWAARPRRNPAGLGVTGQAATAPGAKAAEWQYDQGHNEWKRGYAFPSWDSAASAHVGHILCYALTDDAMSVAQRAIAATNPRKGDLPASYRGSAASITDLNGKWAVPGTTYGQRILAILQAMR